LRSKSRFDDTISSCIERASSISARKVAARVGMSPESSILPIWALNRSPKRSLDAARPRSHSMHCAIIVFII